jgi:hypothetical protein
MESKREHERAGRKGGRAESHKEHVRAGKDAHRGGAKSGAHHLKEGRKHFDEMRGHKSGEHRARKEPHAKVASAEHRKMKGHLGGKGEMTHAARRVEIHHYHHRASEKK